MKPLHQSWQPGALVLLLSLTGLSFPALAFPQLALPPGAVPTGERRADLAEARIAIGPWRADSGVPFDEPGGAVTMRAWRLPADSGTGTLTLIEDLRLQFEAQGYAVRFACFDESCGGFDFRFALPVLDEPQMHVDLGDFRYLAMTRAGQGGKPGEALSILVSRGPNELHLQLLEVTPVPAARIEAETAPAARVNPPPDAALDPGAVAAPSGDGDLGARLAAQGAMVIEGIAFQPGSAELSGEAPPALAELGEWLLANPAKRVVIVGHTDAVGSLSANVALSRQRAAAVRDWLLGRYALAPGQVGAEGAGYLAPRATNETEEGRAQNRRVEVMLTPTR